MYNGPWVERQQKEDDLRKLKGQKVVPIISIKKWVDWDLVLLNAFNRFFRRNK